MFQEYPELVTTEELNLLLAGCQDYIRTKKNEVQGLALRLDMNPDAPEVVVFGKGQKVEARAKLFHESGKVVPVYVKRKVNEWQYRGQYRATAIRQDEASLLRYGYTRTPWEVAGVLFLECMNEPQVEVTGGGYADPRSRGEIESAAVEFVTRTLESEHFVIHDHQRENLGYDLLANKKSVTLYIEVKGTDSPEPRFFISRKERRFAHANADWRLFVVCETRRSPALFRYSCSEMEAEFAFDPLVWECKRGGG